MRDYEPDYVYMIPVNYKKREVFYESIDKVPTRLRGAVLLDDESKENIDFQVYSPQGVLIYSNTTSQHIFDFNVTDAGAYRIVFDNRYSNSDLKVTFTMNTGKHAVLKKEDLSLVDQKVHSLMDFMKSYSLTYKMRHNVHSERYKSNKS